MNIITAALLFVFVFYAAAGLVIGILFVLFGVTKALQQPVNVTIGARIVLFPGSVILWPMVLRRWLKSRVHA